MRENLFINKYKFFIGAYNTYNYMWLLCRKIIEKQYINLKFNQQMKFTNLKANSNIRKFIGAFAALMITASVVSCSSEDSGASAPTVERGLTTISLGATIADDAADSRVNVTGTSVVWSGSADFLYVYGADDVFAFESGEKQSNASFTGELALSEPQKVYAVFDIEEGSADYLTMNTDGQIEYAMTQESVQAQNTYVSGLINISSLGKEIVLYGVTQDEVSEANSNIAITMKHATAVQDFVFSNLPTTTTGPVASLEFITSEPFLTTATLNLDSGEVEPLTYNTNSISVAINLTNVVDASSVEAMADMTIRLAMLPQTVKASAEWSVRITMQDGTMYEKDFGAGTTDYTYNAGASVSIAIDWTTMSEYTPDEVLTLQNITEENTADSDVWTITSGSIAKSGSPAIDELEQFNEVLAAAVADGRDIKVIFSDFVTLVSSIFSNNTDLTVIELPAVTTVSNASAFEGCTSLRSVSAPLIGTGSKTSLANKLFYGCTSLTSLNAPDGEEGIYVPDAIDTFGNSVFAGCSAIETFYDATLTSVSNYVFSNCPSLTSVEIATESTSFAAGTTIFGTGTSNTTVMSNIALVTGVGNGTTVDAEENTWTIDGTIYSGFASVSTK